MALSNRVTSMFKPLDEKQAHCAKHGDYMSKLMQFPNKTDPVWSSCDQCLREDVKKQDQEMAAQQRKQQDQQRINEVLGRSAIPKRFLTRDLKNFTAELEGQKKALSAAARYAREWEQNLADGRCLMMVGRPGTGKTHLAIGIGREVMEKGGTALFCRAHEAISAITETYSKDSTKTERQALDEFKRPDLLIIDEVGRQRGTDNERMMLFEIINRRYDEEKPTLIISNLNLEGLRNYMDEATEDRLRERGGRVITFDWESWRSRV